MSSKEICKNCHLPFLSKERRGSFTSFVFIDMHCQCHLAQDTATTGSRKASKAKVESQSCANCGKVIAKAKRAGSLTSMLLVDLRCSCANPKPKTPRFDMQTRFKPPASLTKRRRDNATRMRTRGVTLTKADTALIELKPGDRIGGDFVLIEQAGQGGMGLVYRARHERLARTVALKFLLPSMVSQESWSQFKQEAKLNSILTHPTICQIYDLGLHQGVLPFYAMDYVDGLTLEEIILQVGSLSIGATLEVFIKAAEGLSYAHRKGVVHKDIKPANIMVEKTDEGDILVKILDFGISQLNDKNSKQEKQDLVVGSAPYMSPEQIRGEPLDARSDIYSLGCSIFETLCGEPPFVADDYDTTVAMHLDDDTPLLADRTDIDMPIEIDAVVQKCMHKEADRRYQNASELIIDLKRIMEEKPLQHAAAELKFLEDESENKNSASAIKPRTFLILGVLTAICSALLFVSFLKSPSSFRPTSVDYTSEPLYLATTENAMNRDYPIEESKKIPSVKYYRAFELPNTTSKTGERYRNFSFPPLKGNTVPFALVTFDRTLDFHKVYEKYNRFLRLKKLNLSLASSYSQNDGIQNESGKITIYGGYGDVSFESNRLVTLLPLDPIIGKESLLLGFGPESIDALSLHNLTASPKSLLSLVPSAFQKIQGITLSGNDQLLACSKIITDFKPEVVLLDNCDFDKLKEEPFAIFKLRTLIIDKCRGALSKLLNSASTVRSPESLRFFSCSISAKDLKLISELPRLQNLELVDCNLSSYDEIPNILAQKTLRKFHWQTPTISFPEGSLGKLKQLPALERLELTFRHPLKSEQLAEIDKLKKLNPDLTVILKRY
jgi:serine/threonine protein kinase